MKRAIYIDTYSTENAHEMFNASSLKMFSLIYDAIEYRAAKSSQQNILNLLKGLPDNIHYKKIILPTWNRKSIGRLFMQIISTITNVYYILTSHKDIDIIINYNTAMSLYPINWSVKLSGKKTLLVCHGEMQDLELKRRTKWIFRKSMTLFTRTNINIAKNLYFAVLGESIKKNVEKVVSQQVKEKLISFDHTAIFNSFPLVDQKESNKLIIGMVGILRESKGSIDFFKLAHHFKGNQHVEFRVIGYLPNSHECINEAGIVIPEGMNNNYVSREEMYNQIRQLDYTVYLLPKDGYKYTASGSIFDTIDCERPIISLHNDYIDYLFSLCGNFGFLIKDTNEMIKTIEKLIENRKSEVFNFKYVKRILSPENAAKELLKTKFYR